MALIGSGLPNFIFFSWLVVQKHFYMHFLIFYALLNIFHQGYVYMICSS